MRRGFDSRRPLQLDSVFLTKNGNLALQTTVAHHLHIAKKVSLANIVAILTTKMFSLGGEAIGAFGAWAGLIAYTFQIFFNFSGYSDMAIGMGLHGISSCGASTGACF